MNPVDATGEAPGPSDCGVEVTLLRLWDPEFTDVYELLSQRWAAWVRSTDCMLVLRGDRVCLGFGPEASWQDVLTLCRELD